MTVLVTGATGFVGRHLVARLIEQRHTVRVLARPSSDAGRLPAGVNVVLGDLSTDDRLDDAVRGCDTVYHLAAAHGADARAEDCERINVHGTLNLAEAAARVGVQRFLFGSTRGVHGLVRGGSIDENTPFSPDTPYRRSKAQAERELARLSAARKLSVITLRLPSMIGPGAVAWLGLFRAIARGNFRIVGSGENKQHPCPVDDAVQAILLAGTTPGIDGETFVFSGTDAVTTAAFVRMIAHEFGVEISRVRLPVFPYHALRWAQVAAARLGGRVAPYSRVEFFSMSYRIDDAKARRVLGYNPMTPLASAVRATVAWYRANGLVT
jgi:nucleoside-diphosphate-sugar epimerase